jgi:DNA-binding NarL/FixJ family response regulator
VEVTDQLQRGRDAFATRSWAEVAEALGAADVADPLNAPDLEKLATALFMVGRQEEHYAVLERAHQRHMEAGALLPAASCAFWIGMRLFMGGEVSRGGGWLARANRLVDEDGSDCVERGYLMLPQMFRAEAAGDLDVAITTAARAAEVGRRFCDPDLFALATHAQGNFLIDLGRVHEGLDLLDEAMLGVASGEVSVMPSGIIYCGAITGCRRAFDPRRASEWTDGLHSWCETQPDMLAFTGDCHLHRAQLMDLHGAWAGALAELDSAARRAEQAGNTRVVANVAYQRGEIQRRLGDLVATEESFREAARGGREPQPGLALLRMAQGDSGTAAAAIRRLREETTDPAELAGLLPAAVEIMLAAGDLEAAREACAELDSIAGDRPSDLLGALAAHMRGAVLLAADEPREALPHLRRALADWHELDAPFEVARTRLLVADACRTLGDEDSAQLELSAAREAFETLGASLPRDEARDVHGLTERELQVLRLVAAGRTNKAIADELVLSERTVDRHVSNILAKLRVASRSAATAYAYEHRLL